MNNPALICQAYAFATVVLWSTAYVYTKVALVFFTPGPLGLVRCAVASLAFLVILPVMGKGRGGIGGYGGEGSLEFCCSGICLGLGGVGGCLRGLGA